MFCGLPKKGDNNSLKYSELNKIYDYQKIDVIINFEHDESDEIIGKKGFLSFKRLKRLNFPFFMLWTHMWSN